MAEKVILPLEKFIPNVWTSALHRIYGLILKINLLESHRKNTPRFQPDSVHRMNYNQN